MAKYVADRNFGKFDGQGRPKNPKGLFVVPTGSASVLTVSSSIKGGTIGSTKDTLQLLNNLEEGGEYEESWHESVHYLDKRVTELSNGVNRLADSNANLSGSVGTIGEANKLNIKALVTNSGSFSTRVTANDAKITSTFPAITSKFENIVGVSINSITYTKFGTLAIVIAITDKLGRTALRSFSIDVDS
jgi:hypothetical protein|tara:strand:+ start:1361 stop:1927 length:567 start_codon:yes stop_codon:yes gene_type:complete